MIAPTPIDLDRVWPSDLARFDREDAWAHLLWVIHGNANPLCPKCGSPATKQVENQGLSSMHFGCAQNHVWPLLAGLPLEGTKLHPAKILALIRAARVGMGARSLHQFALTIGTCYTTIQSKMDKAKACLPHCKGLMGQARQRDTKQALASWLLQTKFPRLSAAQAALKHMDQSQIEQAWWAISGEPRQSLRQIAEGP